MGQNDAQRLVYELWRVSAQTFPDKNWLWKIRRIFQVRTEQAIAYIRCWQQFFYQLIIRFTVINSVGLDLNFNS